MRVPWSNRAWMSPPGGNSCRWPTVPSKRCGDVSWNTSSGALLCQRPIIEHLDTAQAGVRALRPYQAQRREEIEAMTGPVLDGAFRREL